MVTEKEIQNLQIGDHVVYTFDTRNRVPLPNARWGKPAKVVEIFARGRSVDGKAFICFYHEFGPNSKMSHSTHEGDESVRILHTGLDRAEALAS